MPLPFMRPKLVGIAGALSLVGTWNPSDKTASAVLSNGNLTLAGSGSARSTNSITAGKYYFELDLASGAWERIGVSNASHDMNALAFGESANSIIQYTRNGDIRMNATQLSLAVGAGTGHFAFKIDTTIPSFAVSKNGAAFVTVNQLPTGPLFIAGATNDPGAGGNSIVLRRSPLYPVPAGFTLWGN